MFAAFNQMHGDRREKKGSQAERIQKGKESVWATNGIISIRWKSFTVDVQRFHSLITCTEFTISPFFPAVAAALRSETRSMLRHFQLITDDRG